MTTDRDLNRVVRSWMDEGVTALPDRVLDAVLDQVPATPQRLPSIWAAWRFSNMNSPMKFLLAGAAVVVALFIGYNLFGDGTYLGTDPTPSPTTTVAPTPEPTPIGLPSAGALDPGTYLMPKGFGGVAFTFTVPAGWVTDTDGFVHKNTDARGGPVTATTTGVNFASWEVDAVYADACVGEGTEEPVADTVEALATALSSQLGRETSGPTDATVGASPALMVELIAPADLSECGGRLQTWPGLNGDHSSGWPAGPGQTDVVYIVDVNGTRLVIVATHWAGTSAADLAELEAVVNSIQID